MNVACIMFLLDSAGIKHDMEKPGKENLVVLQQTLKICQSLITEFHFPEDGYFWCYINTELKARVASWIWVWSLPLTSFLTVFRNDLPKFFHVWTFRLTLPPTTISSQCIYVCIQFSIHIKASKNKKTVSLSSSPGSSLNVLTLPALTHNC